jgi:hypothetical protein
MKKISIGVSDFVEIIHGDYVYVDKTKTLKGLIESPYNQVFLARPTRFGKTILLKTLQAIFEGDANLFAGLEIAKEGYKFEKYPVVYINMAMDCSNTDLFQRCLLAKLNNIANSEGLERSDFNTLGGVIEDIVTGLYKKHGQEVVVLIDEYDYPFSHNVGDTALANDNSNAVHGFYCALKELEPFLRFFMVTGVTPFSMMDSSYGIDHLRDISFIPKYAAICGFTPEEMDLYYNERYGLTLDNLKQIGQLSPASSIDDLRQEILKFYDGYSWDGRTRVLNPWSISSFFAKCQFDYFWFNNAKSLEFIPNIISLKCLTLMSNNIISVDPNIIFHPKLPNDGSPIPLLFYIGFLTIDTIKTELNVRTNCHESIYNLKIPNFEVNKTFYTTLVANIRNLICKNVDISYSKFINLINIRDSI